MPRRRNNRHHGEDSSSSSDHLGVDGRRGRVHEDEDDDDFDVSFDLRDIGGQIQEEVEYIEKNKNRRPGGEADAMYLDERKGSNVGAWGGKNGGKSAEMGLFSLKSEVGVVESGFGVGEVKVGVVGDDDQLGIEGEVKTVNTDFRVGPAKVNASLLGAGYEAGVGRNTGGFVRGHVASLVTSVGPVGANLGVGFDTGGRVGADGVEVRALGTGFMVDRNQGIEVSLFGSSIKFKPW